MRTSELINNFIGGATKGKASNMHIDGDRLFNYNTVIAQYMGGRLVINKTKYSPTTTKHQNRLLREFTEAETVEKVPMNAWDLRPYRQDAQEHAS